MSTKKTDTSKPSTSPATKKAKTETTAIEDTVDESTISKSSAKTVAALTVDLEKSIKIKKKAGGKVIRDSFSFPEIDYLKILQIKALCLSEGVHVKKGEVLRAGLNLLMQLNQTELKEAIGKVERVKTGRPLTEKS